MKNSENEKASYGLETVLKRIKPEGYVPFTYTLREELADFGVIKTENSRFIAPILSTVSEYTETDFHESPIILIEAVGASGKTELTKNMSYKLKCPVFHLGKTKVVAANSLTGLLLKRLEMNDMMNFMQNIRTGKATMIIDALDEGYLKTNSQGYLDFLEDIVSLNPTKECPIILLGRYNAVELAASYFFEKGIGVSTLQIEPFTLQQAKDFIDKAGDSVAKIKYQPIYKETRDYILETINGFFKDQKSIRTHASERFIGYAPVLQSIAAFFDENTNYNVVLDEMKECNQSSVSLIVDIIQRILDRDRKEKVIPILLQDTLLSGRSEEFKNKVLADIYSRDEQCARILYKVMGVPFPELEIKDPAFLSMYNEHISTWISEHPFMGKKMIANIVFESYILAVLIHNDKYKDVAYRYMREKGVSYMFAYIFHALYGFQDIDADVLPYIYESFRQLNNKQNYYSLTIESKPETSDSNKIECNFVFEGSNDTMTRYEGNATLPADYAMDLGNCLEHVDIDVPFDFKLSKRSVEVVAPSYIKCRKLIIESEEITLVTPDSCSNFMFECSSVSIEQKYDQYLRIVGVGNICHALSIVTLMQLDFPLYNYWISDEDKLKDMSEEVSSRYKKLRSIILEFRSHSKHVLAKHHERIDFVMGINPVGKSVIKALLDKKIMYQEEHLYMLNTDVMDKELGLSYDGIRNFERSAEVVRFLSEIK